MARSVQMQGTSSLASFHFVWYDIKLLAPHTQANLSRVARSVFRQGLATRDYLAQNYSDPPPPSVNIVSPSRNKNENCHLWGLWYYSRLEDLFILKQASKLFGVRVAFVSKEEVRTCRRTPFDLAGPVYKSDMCQLNILHGLHKLFKSLEQIQLLYSINSLAFAHSQLAVTRGDESDLLVAFALQRLKYYNK